MGERKMTFHRGIFKFVDYDETTYTYPATSGIGGETDYKKQDYGPIPPGKYILQPRDIGGGLAWDLYWKYYKEQDWGRYRCPLTPMEGTEVYNRYGFALHGGYKPGSLGCIDVGTPSDVAIRNIIFKPYNYLTGQGLEEAMAPIIVEVLDPPV